MTVTADLDHEHVVVRRGSRSGRTIVVALHSTARGPALGGCRMWPYERARDAIDDALRLSAGMTEKAALAGLRFGGGKAVVALPADGPLTTARRRDALLDVGDVVADLDGRYVTGPDVGTGPADMAVIAERTGNVLCTPGGAGDPSAATAAGTVACVERTLPHLDGRGGLDGRRITVVGLGHVGEHLVRALVAAGARVAVTDIDPGRRAVAAGLGAGWLDPGEALDAPADVLVPAAMGGGLDDATARRLRCAAVVGPANNQLAAESVAETLHARGVLWAPDHFVGAGGIVHATAIEVDGVDRDEAARRVRAVGDTWADVLDRARRDGVGPLRAARDLATARAGHAAPR